MEHPFAVAPPQPTSCIVVIDRLIGEPVVVAMQANPLNRSALAGQRPHQHQDALHPDRYHQAAVGHQTVQAQGDAEDGHPIEDRKGRHALPAPEPGQQRHGGQHMVHQHEAGGPHFQFPLLGRKGLTRSRDRRALPQLAGIGCLRGNQSIAPERSGPRIQRNLRRNVPLMTEI